jgi:hypothetical protein
MLNVGFGIKLGSLKGATLRKGVYICRNQTIQHHWLSTVRHADQIVVLAVGGSSPLWQKAPLRIMILNLQLVTNN